MDFERKIKPRAGGITKVELISYLSLIFSPVLKNKRWKVRSRDSLERAGAGKAAAVMLH